MTANFPGYGYIGINSANIYDVNVRKGLLCLMNREPAVNTYFGSWRGDRKTCFVIWAHPEHAEPAYTYDPDQALAYFRTQDTSRPGLTENSA